jgi:hypothetical protein
MEDDTKTGFSPSNITMLNGAANYRSWKWAIDEKDLLGLAKGEETKPVVIVQEQSTSGLTATAGDHSKPVAKKSA